MLLREFLEQDIKKYLQSLAQTTHKNSTAERDELETVLKNNAQGSSASNNNQSVSTSSSAQGPSSNNSSTQVNSASSPSSSSASSPNPIPNFTPAKNFEATAPIIVQINSGSQTTEEFAPKEIKGDVLEKNALSAIDKGISPANKVDDSSSLRKVIREELSGLPPNMSRPYPMGTSSSDLRDAIRSELNSVIAQGGITNLAKEETLRSIIHDELEKSGAVDKKKKFTPEKIHIDEDLLHPNYAGDSDLKVIEIMKKDPDSRTKREELSVLGKLEDYLVELKVALSEGPRRKAIRLFHTLKTESVKLHFYEQEKEYLLDELDMIAPSLFATPKQNAKQVIIKQSTGEVMDPTSKPEVKRVKHVPVYHVGLDKGGQKTLIKPEKKKEPTKDLFADKKVVAKKIASPSQVQKQKPAMVVSSSRPAKDERKIFYLLEEQKLNGKQLAFHKSLSKRTDLHLFSDSIDVKGHDEQKVQKQKERLSDIEHTMNRNKLAPWEDKRQQMHDPLHTKNYLRAIYALRKKDKDVAIQLLTQLHDEYPRNVAIRVRLHEALQL